MKTSVVIPSKGCKYLVYSLRGLRDQVVKPSEVILVVKDCRVEFIEKLCREYSLPCIIIEQKEGYVTRAYNIGKKEATGDIIIFTDDDAIPLKKWIERYIKLHHAYRDIAGICSRDYYVDLNKLRLIPTPDDNPLLKLKRWFIKPIREPPLPLLRKYRLGVYLSRKLNMGHGPFIPSRTCYSLLYKGVNMSFKANYVYDVWSPEHKLLKRGFGFEQHLGLQLVLKNLDIIFTPNNPVLHIARSESLSRTKHIEEIKKEYEVMKSLYKALLLKYSTYINESEH